MDLLDRWLRDNIDPSPKTKEEQEKAEEAKEEQIEIICRLTKLKERKE